MIWPVVSFFKKRERSQVRRMMRGYQVLKRTGRPDRIAAVKRALTEAPLAPADTRASSLVLGCGAQAPEIVVRQYLLSRVGGIGLNRALLLASGVRQGRVAYHLPKVWREILVQHGFEVARFRSAVLWSFYVCAQLLNGVAKIGKILCTAITREPEPKPHVYFADLTAANVPREINGAWSHDVISWYLQWPGRAKDVEVVHHGVADCPAVTVDGTPVVGRGGPLAGLAGIRAVAGYALWGLCAAVIAAFDLLRGRWWHALLLNQAALASQVRALGPTAIARAYLFHNSEWIYRPLWTYEAERLGSSILFYFYSTNCEPFKKSSGYPELGYGWKAMNWSRYLVWDEHQAEFVRRAAGAKASIRVVGPIWFQGSAAEPPALGRATLAVFDVQPVRAAFYRTLALDFDYYTPETANRFLGDICRIVGDCGGSIALKRKREIGRLAHPSYRHCLQELERRANFVAIDSDLSAFRLIDGCAAVISMPFTSTALLGREMGKPSVFYDPHGVLQKNDRAAHGIEIVRGPAELRNWVAAVLADAPLQRVNLA